MSALLITHNSEAWLPFIKKLGMPVGSEISFQANHQAVSAVQNLSALEQLMRNVPETLQIHLAILPADHFIAEELEKGKKLPEASAAWQKYARGILDFQRQYRDQVKLFNLYEALVHPVEFIKKFEYLVPQKNVSSDYGSGSLPLIAVSYFVSHHSQLNPLNLRLLATCHPLAATDKSSVDVESIIQDYKNTKARLATLDNDSQAPVKLEKELKSSREEAELLLSQLHQVQEKLEEYYLKFKAEEKKNNDMLASSRQSLKETNFLKENVQRLSARAEVAECSASFFEKELAQHRGTIVWRLMAPARVLTRLVKRESRSGKKLQHEINLLLASNYFDKEWYLKQYPDVAESKTNPAEHYLLYGANEGRLPSLLFDGNWYLQQYPDVAEAGINPLLHFLLHGLREERKSLPVSTKS